MIDLLFDELDEGRRRLLLGELEGCAPCREQYRALSETLEVFDGLAEATVPAEQFWPCYEERLRNRMAQEIRPNVWQQAAAATLPFAPGEYRVTFLEDEGLVRRLARELKAAALASQLTWPEFKRDPFGFAGRSAAAYSQVAWKFFSQRNVALATFSSFFVISAMLGSIFALERFRASHRAERAGLDGRLVVTDWLSTDIPGGQESPEEGPAGLNSGTGGGSKPKYERPGGGGGGGRESQSPTSFGKAAPGTMQDQLMTPSVREPVNKNPQLAVSPTIVGDPLLLPDNPAPLPFGDPRSNSTTPSDGPGKGGGQGTGEGTGQGPGEGRGYGPGRGENIGGGDTHYGGGGAGGAGGGAPVDYGRTFKSDEVTRRAIITYKPEPNFTEEARKNNVTGTVRLKAVLSASGQVTNITVLKGLPGGLTEKAIAAARQIRFTPAQKDGRTVSQYVTLEYNFNIY